MRQGRPGSCDGSILVTGLIECFMIQGSGYPFWIEFIVREGGVGGLTEDQVPAAL